MNTFEEKPNQVSILAYDALGLIYYCWINNNEQFKIEQLYNKSGFTQPYLYQFSDLTDGGPQMFNYQEGEITLGPDESIDISFLITKLLKGQ